MAFDISDLIKRLHIRLGKPAEFDSDSEVYREALDQAIETFSREDVSSAKINLLTTEADQQNYDLPSYVINVFECWYQGSNSALVRDIAGMQWVEEGYIEGEITPPGISVFENPSLMIAFLQKVEMADRFSEGDWEYNPDDNTLMLIPTPSSSGYYVPYRYAKLKTASDLSSSLSDTILLGAEGKSLQTLGLMRSNIRSVSGPESISFGDPKILIDTGMQKWQAFLNRVAIR